MKRFVDGQEIELADEGFQIAHLNDRMVVKGADGSNTAVAVRQGDAILVSYRGRQFKVEKKVARRSSGASANSGELRAPMPGAIVEVLVEEGSAVIKGDKILVLEAMKTQQPFVAPFDGLVSKIAVKRGDQVNDGAVLAVVSPQSQDSQP